MADPAGRRPVSSVLVSDADIISARAQLWRNDYRIAAVGQSDSISAI